MLKLKMYWLKLEEQHPGKMIQSKLRGKSKEAQSQQKEVAAAGPSKASTGDDARPTA